MLHSCGYEVRATLAEQHQPEWGPLGSKADLRSRMGDVGFTPKSGHGQRRHRVR